MEGNRAGVGRLRLFEDDQLRRVHEASMQILQRTGARVQEPECVRLLADAGCDVSDGDLVRIPERLVQQALATVPGRIDLYGRDGARVMSLHGERSYFGTGSDLPYTRDLETGERRQSLLSDVAATARLVDGLDNLDFVMSSALPSDVDGDTSDRRSFATMLESTVKPIVFTAWSEAGLEDVVEMASIVAGDAERLRQRPSLLAYLEPSSPLQHTGDALRKLRRMSEHGLPFVYAPGPVDGATAPVTPAGSLAMANAEVLTGLVIAQLVNPGSPFLYGSGSGPLDMRTAVATYASPEFLLNQLAIAELGHRLYRLPVWGFSGCSDAKTVDVQVGAESAMWILWSALAGSNLVHDNGYIESGLTCSWEMIVVCDEVVGFVRRLLQGIDLSPADLALDTVHGVGPGGNFLETEHTLRNFDRLWMPRLFDRQSFPAWEASGSRDTRELARERVRSILASHEPPPLDAEVRAGIQDILGRARTRTVPAG